MLDTSEFREIVYSNGVRGEVGDIPIAVTVVKKHHNTDGMPIENRIVDPIFNHSVTDNLYGRMMTLLEATCDSVKLKAVKDIFGKELGAWANDVYNSAREITNGGDSSTNIYTRR